MINYNHIFYTGGDYSLEPKYSDLSNSPFIGYQLPQSSFGLPTDPRTANQIEAVTKKINTGVKTIEVSGVSPEVLDNIPKQHFKEIRRLKELVGIDLTFHGPLVEPTGTTQNGFDPALQINAERQIVNALDRAKDLGDNVIVTFHASNGLPEPRTIIKDPETGEKKTTQLLVVDERTGKIGAVPRLGENYFLGEKQDVDNDLKKLNETSWSQMLTNLSIEAERARERIELLDEIETGKIAEFEDSKINEKKIMELYNYSNNNPSKYDKYMEELYKVNKSAAGKLHKMIVELNFAKRFSEEAYLGLQEAYNKAYYDAKKDPEKKDILYKLEDLKKEIVPLTKKIYNDPEKLKEFTSVVIKGINMLNSIKEAPQIFKPLENFAAEKAAETFANAAFKAYENNKGDINKVPIISIENPPVGMGFSTAQDIEKIVNKARENLSRELIENKNLSESEAKKIAEKMIGVTWDVGHINMLRKYGYDKADIISQTKKIAPYVKHIHLSDNFGLEHTELPMGMGNVPIKEHEEELKKKFGDKIKQIKRIIETGGWYQYFKIPPLAETFEAYGSPIYSMKMAPYWNSTRGIPGGYFSGYGKMLPDINFSTYGAGFSSLPAELGGQVMGGRNRLSGSPME